MKKVNQINIGSEIFDIEDKRIDEGEVPERMLEVDKRGLESGDYNKDQYDAFREKFPNRVYLEKYNKYPDGSEVERIYNKVALTAYPDPPEDFDEGDKGYMLESVPTRCGGGFPDSDTAYQKGHIRVPALSIDEFPTEDDAQSFAITRTYADSAIIRHNIRKTIKKADTLDDKCIGVNTTKNVSSSLSFYSDNANSKYSIFKCSVWRDFSTSTSGSFEITLNDTSGNILFYAIIFPYNTWLSYLSRPSGKRVYFDAKVHMPYGQWSNIYIEYNATTGSPYAKLYINEELVATLDGTSTDIGTTSNQIYMTVTNSMDLVGKVALANIAFLTANSATALTSDNYFDLDNYTEIPTSDSSTGKKIIRNGAADVWSIAECEDFTGEGEYVVVNKKYLRKMLENIGAVDTRKKYKHNLYFTMYAGAIDMMDVDITIVTFDETPITTTDMVCANIDYLNNPEEVSIRYWYDSNNEYADSYYFVDIVQLEKIVFGLNETTVKYYMSTGGTLLTRELDYGLSSVVTEVVYGDGIKDTVTEV